MKKKMKIKCYVTFFFFFFYGYLWVLLLYLPFVLLRQKGGVIFILVRSVVSFCTGYMFLSHNGQKWNLLVILVLCKYLPK